VRLSELSIAHLRCLTEAQLRPQPGINLFTGDNGAGKTSVIEAVHLLAYGRSFRGRVRDGLIQQGHGALRVVAQWREGDAPECRGGIEHSGRAWTARVNGETLKTLADLAARIAVVTFEPGSHALISGAAEHRRRFLDWALFHVEPAFMTHWRRYARALRQRNALLKHGIDAELLLPWEHELHASGEAITVLRAAYVARWSERLAHAAHEFLPELGPAQVQFSPGWRRDATSLGEALLASRRRDQVIGYSSVGPHRADWRVEFALLPGREALSRGQTKLTALACVLAQAREFAASRGEWPLVCLDDFSSELDQSHQRRVVAQLVQSGAQVLLTGTEVPAALDTLGTALTRFHVEQGVVRALL